MSYSEVTESEPKEAILPTPGFWPLISSQLNFRTAKTGENCVLPFLLFLNEFISEWNMYRSCLALVQLLYVGCVGRQIACPLVAGSLGQEVPYLDVSRGSTHQLEILDLITFIPPSLLSSFCFSLPPFLPFYFSPSFHFLPLHSLTSLPLILFISSFLFSSFTV